MKKGILLLLITAIGLLFFAACEQPGSVEKSSPVRSVEERNGAMMEALEALKDRGSIGDPDHDKEGTLWVVYPSGYYRQVSFNEAVSLVKSYKWVDTNGSGNSLSAAISNSKLKAAAFNKTMVLVYMAQGMDYWNANDITYKSVYSSLINSVTATVPNITVLSHSWSGHLVQDLVKYKSGIVHYAFNPAHGSFKAGEGIDDFIYDIRTAQNKMCIITGRDDVVTTEGGGSAYKIKYWWGSYIWGYNDVYYAIRDTSKVDLVLIDGAGHGMDDMLAHGAASAVSQCSCY